LHKRLYDAVFKASAHMGAAYSIVDVTTAAMILLLCCFGPRVLVIILEMAAIDLDALATAYDICVLNDLWSISTPRYLIEALVSIGFDPTRILPAAYEHCLRFVLGDC